MFNIRRFARLIPKISKTTNQWVAISPITKIQLVTFCQQKRKPTEQEMKEVKENAKEFYGRHVEDIIQLEKYQDWQPIVEGCTQTLLIDFYAQWCAPCKKLTPKLQEKVRNSKGKLKLLKIDIDKFGKIAQSFQIKAVPTVYMVYSGKAVDAFSGQITDQKLDKFLETAGRASEGDKELERVGLALEEGKSLLNLRDYAGAQKVLLGIKYNKVPDQYKLVGDIFLACAYSEQNKMAQIKAIVEVMKINALFYQQKEEFKELFSHLCELCEKFEKEKEQSSEFATWKAKLEADPANLDLRFEAAQFFKQNQMIEEGLDQLLIIVRASKDWQDKKANKQILSILKQLGPSSPLTKTYRRQFQQALN